MSWRSGGGCQPGEPRAHQTAGEGIGERRKPEKGLRGAIKGCEGAWRPRRAVNGRRERPRREAGERGRRMPPAACIAHRGSLTRVAGRAGLKSSNVRTLPSGCINSFEKRRGFWNLVPQYFAPSLTSHALFAHPTDEVRQNSGRRAVAETRYLIATMVNVRKSRSSSAGLSDRFIGMSSGGLPPIHRRNVSDAEGAHRRHDGPDSEGKDRRREDGESAAIGRGESDAPAQSGEHKDDRSPQRIACILSQPVELLCRPSNVAVFVCAISGEGAS